VKERKNVVEENVPGVSVGVCVRMGSGVEGPLLGKKGLKRGFRRPGQGGVGGICGKGGGYRPAEESEIKGTKKRRGMRDS